MRTKKDETFLYDLLYFVSILTIAAVLLSLIFVVYPDSDFGEMAVASQTGSLLRMTGIPADVINNFIIMENLQVEIVQECVGWLGLFAVAALILAYPRVPWGKRVFGLAFALPIMYIINLLRVFTTLYLGYHHGQEVFEFVHSVLWKTLLVGFALLIWWLWLKFVVDAKETPKRKKKKKKLFKR